MAFRLSNNLVGILNLVVFVLSIPILAGGIWLSHRSSTDCEKFLQAPIIAIGVFLLVVSLCGLVGACCRNSLLLWIYLLVMFLLIVLLFCFTIFAFVVTNKGAGEVVSGRGYKEYRLGDYSNWLQKRVESSKNWRKIRSCLVDSKVCQRFEGNGNRTLDQFVKENLSPLQSGCCKPPTACGFIYQSATVWNKPANGFASNNTDCPVWNNDPNTLCYDCESCKAGVLANIKDDWKKVSILNIIFLVFLVVVYSVGCCAFRNNREDYAYPRWKGHP
ncbi:tetraspanin-8-like [Asparagus officinalis]|uniref:tetraspanin-8-like n=1 Tax=Asparagus officinalis TaxID=4686 RepID=UPI00098E70B2|nr:tetraspanin-8-like [Asparagus officinalis]